MNCVCTVFVSRLTVRVFVVIPTAAGCGRGFLQLFYDCVQYVCVCVSFVAASHRGVCVAVSVCGGVDLHPLKIELGWREGGASHVERWTQCSNTAASLLFPQLKVITSPLCPHCTSESPRLTVHRVTDLMFYVHCVM